MEHSVKIVRVYDSEKRLPNEYRVLVDRLWPRGFAKGTIDYDEWAKDIAPSPELRKWYGHLPARFEEFSSRYRNELTRDPASTIITRLARLAREKQLILLTATRDIDHSGATVLKEVVEQHALG
ncbi:MAG: DUF488 family protein [Actinobacteria bacterium]|nr:DUF488 family protein [Actinomycetota bacterium]MCL6095484.1 DUF488 family protein [Actinomycetota bacterium]